MDPYNDERQLLLKWNAVPGASWKAIADALGETKATWWNIAHGQRDPTLQQRNVLRRHFGLPEVLETPAEVVVRMGIKHVVNVSDAPDTALLLDVAGQKLERVSITVEPEAPITESEPKASIRRRRKTRNRKRSTVTFSAKVKERLDATKGDRTWDEWAEMVVEMLCDA